MLGVALCLQLLDYVYLRDNWGVLDITTYLQGLPQSAAPDSNTTRARWFAHTVEGRRVLVAFAREVARLVQTQEAQHCAERAEQATEWQSAFEAAVTAQQELETVLWGATDSLSNSLRSQDQRNACYTKLEELTRRLLDQARGAA